MHIYFLSLQFRQCRCIILEYRPSVFKTFWLGNNLGYNLVKLRTYAMNKLICILLILGKLY
jgi:hypothetical protein